MATRKSIRQGFIPLETFSEAPELILETSNHDLDEFFDQKKSEIFFHTINSRTFCNQTWFLKKNQLDLHYQTQISDPKLRQKYLQIGLQFSILGD